MNTRKEFISATKQCRFCLRQDGKLKSLYEKSRTSKNTLAVKILSVLNVEVFPSDKMPMFICDSCKFFMNIFYDFKQICRQADEKIFQYIQHGYPFTAIQHTPALIGLYQEHQTSKGHVVETIVEGGATVQVSQDLSDTDDEDSSVYNVQTEDGLGKCVKVVTSKTNQEGFNTVSKLERHIKNHAGDRPYPCKFCNKSFVLPHHYTRHLRVKHKQSSFEMEQFRCEECDKAFFSQDDLIFHSAIHTTQNLTCPLCQEKFEDVDAVTAHIKTHVNGVECMCDFCELVFTTKEKLDKHIMAAHQDELNVQGEENDESSMEMDRDEEEDNGINVKEENGEMVVEIKKGDFLLPAAQDDSEDKIDTEDSEAEASLTEMPESGVKPTVAPPSKPDENLATITPVQKPVAVDNQMATLIQKSEEIKRKATQRTESAPPPKKVKPEGASDKSLRLLEKELQELKRTNSRVEVKSPAKTVEMRSRRAQLHTSTPRPRSTEEKRSVVSKAPVPERKLPERRAVTKENKEPKDAKDAKELKDSKEIKDNKETKESKEIKDTKESKDIKAPNDVQETKDVKESKVIKETKDIKETKNSKDTKDSKDTKEAKNSVKEDKEKEVQRIGVKNGGNDKAGPDESIRRSSRPSKVKDYARMVRSHVASDDDDGTTDDDEEYSEPPESQQKRRPSIKPTPQKQASPGVARKRGRPRKSVSKDVPLTVKKNEDEEPEQSSETPKPSEEPDKPSTPQVKTPTNHIVSPTGQTLKKVPIKALPPGVKPLPLPANARGIGGELCEMQIGKKMVKVQKIVMTKAEVEAMAKRGLVEMKGGTMVLKQGIKLPATVNTASKSPVVADEPATKPISAPSRCNIDEEE